MLESIPRRKVASETGTETISSQNIYGMKVAYQTSTEKLFPTMMNAQFTEATDRPGGMRGAVESAVPNGYWASLGSNRFLRLLEA